MAEHGFMDSSGLAKIGKEHEEISAVMKCFLF